MPSDYQQDHKGVVAFLCISQGRKQVLKIIFTLHFIYYKLQLFSLCLFSAVEAPCFVM